MKAISLTVVYKGVAETYAPEHVDARVVDCDNIDCGDGKVLLPKGVGFEELVKDAGLWNYVKFVEDE